MGSLSLLNIYIITLIYSILTLTLFVGSTAFLYILGYFCIWAKSLSITIIAGASGITHPVSWDGGPVCRISIKAVTTTDPQIHTQPLLNYYIYNIIESNYIIHSV